MGAEVLSLYFFSGHAPMSDPNTIETKISLDREINVIATNDFLVFSSIYFFSLCMLFIFILTTCTIIVLIKPEID